VNLDRLLAPRSVAVVGASPRVDTYGHQTLDNLVAAQFDGPVYGVHPRESEVLGVPCFPTLSDLPEVPDAIVIATPAATVPGLIDEAGQLGCVMNALIRHELPAIWFSDGQRIPDDIHEAARKRLWLVNQAIACMAASTPRIDERMMAERYAQASVAHA